MCENPFLVFLAIFSIIHLSQQQFCYFSCYTNRNNHDDCTKSRYISANTTVSNADNGIVEFEFEYKCDIQSYKIQLDYHNNKSDCGSFFSKFKAHSEYVLNLSSNSSHDKCNKTGTVFFQNIKTGCYKVLVLVVDNNSKFIYNKVVFLETKYTKQELDVNKTNTSYGCRNNGTELKFHIENPILHVNPLFSLSFICDNCSNFSDYYNLIIDESDNTKLVLHPKDANKILNISCSYNQENASADCVIFPVTIIKYDIIITFVGNPNKCPQHVFPSNQIKIRNISVKADYNIVQKPMDNSSSEKIIGITLGIFCSIIAFCSLMLIIKLIEKSALKYEQNANVPTCEVKVEDKSCGNLLFLYARSTENIMETLSSFRNIFTHLNINVYDIYDSEKLKDINADNHNWILNLTNREDINIIIFLTPAGEYLSNLPEMQESVDALYLFAIKQLLSRLSNDYEFNKKIFVAHFENDDNKYADYEMFSPNLRFSVPRNITELFQCILKKENISFNNKMNNEYNKFLENYEKQLIL